MDCIIFDIDGTLTDTEEQSTQTLFEALKEVTGKEYDKAEIRAYFGMPAVETVVGLGITEQVDLIVHKWVEGFKRSLDREQRLYEGIPEVIEELHRRGIAMGLVTSKNKRQFETAMKRYSFYPYFIQSVYADLTRKHKPDPEPLEKFFELTGFSKENAIYIGDTSFDLDCARGAGVAFGLAGWGCMNPRSIEPDVLLHTPEEILKLI